MRAYYHSANSPSVVSDIQGFWLLQFMKLYRYHKYVPVNILMEFFGIENYRAAWNYGPWRCQEVNIYFDRYCVLIGPWNYIVYFSSLTFLLLFAPLLRDQALLEPISWRR